MNAYGIISRLCKTHGIEVFGATDASPFDRIEHIVQNADLRGFCKTDANKRIDPRLTLPDAKSIICVLFPYENPKNGDSSGYKAETAQGKIVSGDVWLGEDYHFYVMRKLNALCAAFRESLGGEYMPFCDTGPLVDKEIAVRAGLCEYGRNSLAISQEYGSFFYIGYILTDLELEDASVNVRGTLSELCEGCYRCVKACLSGALAPDKPFNYSKCISYISQKKGALTEAESLALGNTLYGCHICQNVCPANEKTEFVKYYDVEEILSVSNSTFKRRFGDTAARFIGRNRFVRNAHAVCENTGREV